ncbi:hypothetical protein G6F65_021513 [Rhizopus arrhizus]|nr:hypothetical protein G6F65_021513 [Rhizopus arrhizus]
MFGQGLGNAGLLATGGGGARAARGKRTAGGQVQQVGRHAGNLAQALPALVVAGQAVDQAHRVRMLRAVQHVVDLAVFDDAAGVHHGHVVGQTGHNGQIMRDPDQAGAVLLRQLLHFGQDLRLDGDVQRGGRLIRDDQVGAVQHGNGNGHALAHAARQLVRHCS